MPLGSNYKISEDRGFLEILEDFLIIAETVSQLHKTGHFHRDIKPDNLLYVRGKICLTDFGLIGCLNDNIRLTKEHDHIGPYRILPPELLDIVETRTDYRKSDVYLLAKTLWMVLKKNNNGFWGEYNRGKMIGLNASEYGTETLQPLHELMELATKYEYDERIDIEKFIYFLQLQKAIVEGKVSKAELYKFIHNEAVNKHLHLISSDETVYVEKNKIERVLCDCTKNCRICLNPDADEDFGRILQIERTGLDLYTIQTAKFPYFTGTKNYNVFVSEVKVIQDLEQCIVITCRSDSAVPKQAQCCINMTDAMRSPFSEVYLSAEIVLYLKV